MKNYLILGLFILGTAVPSFVGAVNTLPDGWVLNKQVSKSEWIKNAAGTTNEEKCKTVINRTSCNYTGPKKVLRLGYEYLFADEFWAGDRNRQIWAQCTDFNERQDYNQVTLEDGTIQEGINPIFKLTPELTTTNNYWVNKNTSMVIIEADKIYKINGIPNRRSSDNLSIKYIVEYSNDEEGNTRYQHTECYPYEISRCGDGVVDTDWFKKGADKRDTQHLHKEECDPNDPDKKGREDGSGKYCSKSCKLQEYETPVCSSEYNGKTEYTSSSAQWLKSTDKLCDKGEVDGFDFSPKTGGPRTYTWNCKNGSKVPSSCTARQEWCGDGIVQEKYEDCDDGDNNGKSTSLCSKSCKSVSASCGTKDKGTTYFQTKKTTPWLTEQSEGMCADGLIVGKPVMDGDNIKWTCTNINGGQKECKAYQKYCGDGEIQREYGETCDGGDFCNDQCKIVQPEGCTKIFTGSFRLGDTHLFEDKFSAGWHNRYFYNDYKEVSFKENYGDHNNGKNPEFDWSEELKAKSLVLPANAVDFPGIRATSIYNFVNKPTKRAWNNIEVEYTVRYSDEKISPTPAKTDLYREKECAYYEISWCGDGFLDEKYGEKCDPEAEPWKSNHSCDPETCKEKKPACNSSYSGQVVESLVSGNYLCEVGFISDFEYNDATHKWTWKCQNVAGDSKSCYARKPYNGGLKVEKTLSGSKYVTQTGQELVWKIKVTATGGDVKDPQISDKLPPVLDYVSYTGVKIPSSITSISNPTFSGNNKIVEWKTKGLLKSGDYIELKVVTKVNAMPKTTDEYRNVACAWATGLDINCQPASIKLPGLRINKYILDGDKEVKNKTVKVGDEIVYKIAFGNSGNSVATVTSIKDFLPKNVQYKSSKINIIRTSTHSSGTQKGDEEFKGYKIVDGMYIDIYGGLTLEPGDRGYIILTGTILSGNQDNRTNFACIYLNNERVDCDNATHNFNNDNSLICSTKDFKISTGSFSNVGGSTTVSCETSPNGEKAEKIELNCGSGGVIQGTSGPILLGSNISSLTGTCVYPSNSSTSTITYTVTCTVNNKTTGNCKGNVTVDGQSCFPAGTKITMADGTFKNIENVKEGDTVLSYNTKMNRNEISIVKQRIVHVDSVHEMYELTINGNVLKVTDIHPFYVRKSLSSMDYDWIEAKDLKVGDVLLMSDGNLVKIENINHYNNQETVYNLDVQGNHNYFVDKGYLVHNKGGGGGPGGPGTSTKDPSCTNIKVDKNNNIVICESDRDAYFKLECGDDETEEYISDDKDTSYPFKNKCKDLSKARCSVSSSKNGTYHTSNSCKRTKPIEGNDQGCFNVNAGNFSIEEGEILPFYWNMHNMNHFFTGGEENYTEIIKEGDYRNAPSTYSTPPSENCDGGQEGKVALDSMVCVFNIYDGSGYHKGIVNGIKKDNPLYTIEGPCLSKTSAIKSNNLIKNWYKTMTSVYCNDPNNNKDCVFYFKDESAGKDDDVAVLPTAVYYIQDFGTKDAGVYLNAGGNEGDWTFKGKLGSATDKSFGEYKIELSNIKYLQCEGGNWEKKEAKDNSDFIVCQNDFMLTNSYTVQKTPSGNLTASTEKLKKYLYYSGNSTFADLLNAIQTSEYTPNAKVNEAMSGFINKYKKLAVKVELSNTKFLEGSSISKVPGKSIYFVDGNITVKGGKDIDKAFTIVQTKGDATIEGDVGHNMMLLTKGNLTFKGNCTSDQSVKGIFYAQGTLDRKERHKNDSKDHEYWCTNGGLHIKGVLIGYKFNDLMNHSRSNLNDWFKAKGTSEQINNQRRKYVMNGASVVIEYSPSIFNKSTMPPGAEDFTTALSIYKQ